MDEPIKTGLEIAQTSNTLELKVRYIAARKPFVEEKAPDGETLATLKPTVLKFFGLVEGAVDGVTKTYEFSLNGKVLNDLGVTLGTVAQGKNELKLDLIERFEQG